MPGPLAGSRQRRIFGKKAIARMNRIDLFLRRQIHDAFYIEISLHRTLALADQVSFVRFESMQAQPVFLRITATVLIFSSLAARRMRMAISPRFRARSFFMNDRREG